MRTNAGRSGELPGVRASAGRPGGRSSVSGVPGNGAVWVLRGSADAVTGTGAGAGAGAVSLGASSVGISESGQDPVFGDAMSGS
ncbi:hypothetical protein [Streptomyces sp. SID337]|uniref:hypothetical protein n=1 Tax=Streptomyces sp. SID337 TaxID=2690262 RepID=UPI00137DE1A5|nr:hypothetical protein [Streptomyces sp. SID337]MYZ18921.1 hypothetical protein [Streptomyces sp. SID337]